MESTEGVHIQLKIINIHKIRIFPSFLVSAQGYHIGTLNIYFCPPRPSSGQGEIKIFGHNQLTPPFNPQKSNADVGGGVHHTS